MKNLTEQFREVLKSAFEMWQGSWDNEAKDYAMTKEAAAAKACKCYKCPELSGVIFILLLHWYDETNEFVY